MHGDRSEAGVDGQRQERHGVGATRAGHDDTGRDTEVPETDALTPGRQLVRLVVVHRVGGGAVHAAVSTRANQSRGAESSSIVGRNSGPRQAASMARGPASRSIAATNASPTSY